MKKTLLFTALVFSFGAFAQTQIGNGDMESWNDDPTDAPDNWNSFLSATGTWSGAAADQCDVSTDVRPGTSGTSSVRIWSAQPLGFGPIANGNLTLGQINMGSTTPTSSSNYNFSKTADVEFSEALTDHPDSIVFWAKFTPNGGNGNARMRAALHTANYDYRDPEDASSTAELVASAVVNYPNTNGSWVRFSVPFDYSGAAALANQAFILVTFTTNETPGGGDANDEVLIDDVELIYNPAVGIEEVNGNSISVSMDNNNNMIKIISDEEVEGQFAVYNTSGQMVADGDISNEIPFDAKSGVYFVHMVVDGRRLDFEIYKD